MTAPDAAAVVPDLIGYASRVSVAPGEELSFMVGADVERAEARLVRLLHGDERSPLGLIERELPSSLDGAWRLERQRVHPGSFGLVEAHGAFAAGPRALSGHLFACPTLTGRAAPQGLLAHVGADGARRWELVAETGGELAMRVFGDGGELGCARIAGALRDRVWHAIGFAIDAERARVELWVTPLSGLLAGVALHVDAALAPGTVADGPGPLLLAARRLIERAGEPRAADTFDGKLERPTLLAGRLDAEAAGRLARGVEPDRIGVPLALDLDLGAAADGWELVDRSPHAHRGRLWNAPLRAVPSHRWRGEQIAPALASAAYAAVRFHADDVHHADWRPTRSWTVPAELASGLYALRLRADGAEDRIPFVVRPPRDRATQRVALWLPTFTYAAYANARECQAGKPYGDFRPAGCAGDEQLARHPEWGGSTYDVHADGSGVAISSLARPVPNLRPTYRAGLVDGPRHLSADLYLVHWLEHAGVAVDVIADEDVHADGVELLQRYATVLTGSHPEYVTGAELDAVDAYVDGGGRLMYMGGNGFYWVTSVEPGNATTVEVRRGHAGTRCWDAAPGEQHHQLTGEPGGLWRHRGRPPHALVGIGFVAEGRDGANGPYRRAPASFEPAGAWAFAGIGPDEPIGAGGHVMAGAAGDELDSADGALGTPPETLVLATADGHSDAYWLVIEDLCANGPDLSGSRDARIRADVALTPTRNGGAVFAVGSMSWAGALSQRGYDNPVARLSENVLRAFAAGATPWLEQARSVSAASE
ncbi:MAG TPA: N,N-dimethylformamidase beta subunit family domain-containing protein [Conexibacter sp.]